MRKAKRYGFSPNRLAFLKARPEATRRKHVAETKRFETWLEGFLIEVDPFVRLWRSFGDRCLVELVARATLRRQPSYQPLEYESPVV